MTGVSVQRLVEKSEGIDAGDIVGQVGDVAVPNDASFPTLMPVLADISGRLLVDVLRGIMAGTITATPQDLSQRTLAPKIHKETGHIRWLEQTAVKLDRLCRGVGHQAPLWSELHGARYHFLDLRHVPTSSVPSALRMDEYRPGTAFLDKSPASDSRRILIACVPESVTSINPWVRERNMGQSWIEVVTIRKEGRQEMPVGEWWNGLPNMERKRNWVQFKARRFLEEDEEEA